MAKRQKKKGLEKNNELTNANNRSSKRNKKNHADTNGVMEFAEELNPDDFE